MKPKPLIQIALTDLTSLHITWPHIFAFLIAVGSIVFPWLSQQMAAHQTITWTSAFAALAATIWMAFLRNVLQPNDPPTNTVGGQGKLFNDDSHPTPPPGRNEFSDLGFLAFAMSLCLVAVIIMVSACVPASVPNAFMAEAQCVENEIFINNDTDVGKIILACGPQEANVILSLVEALLLKKSTPDAGLATTQYNALVSSIPQYLASHPEVASHIFVLPANDAGAGR